mmetsp:Transcript_30588/g.50510  ORF Transcript_30588/g.50510 Transcript_30588/m.50510 type:complete len:352 (-) Transcript_30588:13-1068(-)
MVGSNRQIRIILQTTNDIQIRHARLDHEHISTLRFIEGCFNECLAAIGGVLLVGLLVAKARVGIEGIAKWSVVGRGVLGRVGQNGNVGKAFGIEGIANSLDAAVHHIARSHNIGTSTGLTDHLLAQLIDGSIIDNLAIFDNAIVSLIRIRIERHVRHDDRFGEFRLDHANGTGDNALGVVRFDTQIGFQFIRNLGEQDKGIDSQSQGFFNFRHHAVEGVTLASRHAEDFRIFGILVNKERVDKVIGCDDALADHASNGSRFAVAAGAGSLFVPYFSQIIALQCWIGASRWVKRSFGINAFHGLVHWFGSLLLGAKNRCRSSRKGWCKGINGCDCEHKCKDGRVLHGDRMIL